MYMICVYISERFVLLSDIKTSFENGFENKDVGEKLSITTLRKWQGNFILVSMICDIHDSARPVVDCKSWTLGWDSLVPSGV